MKASELIEELKKKIAEYGDLEVYLPCGDGSWYDEVERIRYDSWDGGKFDLE